ncbi:methyltransferase [Streptomyces cinnamoneus]|uniref:Methyltransferase n=1 Tax=Streptomyces cinnamoneus TaxID=53446 RepID=A0A2G1XM13_STRCJ|nr:class I SAM-dependent methyltransferase [Streptomyces cinnamoneus]PHQ52250.1 methyltransferase [Streptomyces cinnamoneus]PPT12183.1 methyltransferase domain-containing protein [Streptomyces cinnamoneus]
MDNLVADVAAASAATRDETQVPSYYTRKTADILHKYGPGPRVHFHVGLFDPGSTPNTTVSQQTLRRRLRESQEAALDHAARSWGVPEDPPAQLFDIGCGLGGGSIYWAQEYGCSVTAMTVTAKHVPVVADLVRQAGVEDLVTPVLGDIHDLREQQAYDAAVAIESSGYMDRERLFNVVANALKPGGWFGLQEHFLCRPEWTSFIDGYYKTRLGTLAEYITAAHRFGFTLEQDEDVTDRVAEFWVQSMAWTTAELDRVERAGAASPISAERLLESALTHSKLFRVWRDHAVETRMLLFRLKGGN